MEYKIGSFNMEKFGATRKKDFEKIAEIIIEEDLDVVALQEIFSEGAGLKRLLASCVDHDLYNWGFCLPDPLETKDFNPRGETYAYLWNKRKFKLIDGSRAGIKKDFKPRIVSKTDVGADCSFLARAPFYARLQPVYGGFFELRLINIHIHFGDNTKDEIDKRKIEFDFLTQQIYPEICRQRYGQHRKAYTIAMGDYNLNIFSPGVKTENTNCYLSAVYSYNDGRKKINILTMQEQLTTLRSVAQESDSVCRNNDGNGYANNYDHFTYSPELSDFVNVSCQAIDAVEKYCGGDFEYYRKNISDHLPIVMTIEI